jgi:integrase
VAEQAKWYAAHHVARHRGKARETVILAHLVRVLGTLDLRLVDRTTAQEYQTQRMGEGVGAATVNREMTLLKSLLSAAVPRVLKVSPLAGYKRLPATVERKRMVRPDEEAALIKALTGETRDLYVVAVDTLLRQQNVANLARSEVKDGYLALRDSKTGPYTVPLSTRAAAIIRARMKDAKPGLFPQWRARSIVSSGKPPRPPASRPMAATADLAGTPQRARPAQPG